MGNVPTTTATLYKRSLLTLLVSVTHSEICAITIHEVRSVQHEGGYVFCHGLFVC